MNALKAFEAAARHLSVKSAAHELCVTPGAVSQMIKNLETHLGTKLFQRIHGGIFLTDVGQTYLPPIRNAFRLIDEASQKIETAADSGVLTLSVTPFFASAWLVPRLASFQCANPDIDLRIVTSNALVDFHRSGVDVAIRHGLGRYPGLSSDHILAVEIVPVASPDLVARRGWPKRAADLAAWPKVHDAERQAWHGWFVAHGLAAIETQRGPSFDDSSLLLQAVQTGQGAGLLPAALVAQDVAEARLVRLAKAKMVEDVGYYLVYPGVAKDRPKVVAFRRWILAAAGKVEHASARRRSSRHAPLTLGHDKPPPAGAA